MLKILFISHGDHIDYMPDTLLHGLYNTEGIELTHSAESPYMYKENHIHKASRRIHGFAFTLYGLLPEYKNDNCSISEKIKDRYFDYIIYGSIYRCKDYMDLVLEHYPKNRICFVNGEDMYRDTDDGRRDDILYFKREITYNREITSKFLPISFSIPEEKIIKDVSTITKVRRNAIVQPCYNRKYIYREEADYYKDYQDSYFGTTRKKLGWDCLRHYEILANYCVPYFRHIEGCPEHTLTHLPKSMLFDIMLTYERNLPIDEGVYKDWVNYLFQHTKDHLTTVKMVKYLLEKLCQ